MKTEYMVQNGVSRATFTKPAIDKMQMLGLIHFRGYQRFHDKVRAVYTAKFDNRPPVKAGSDV